MTPRRSPLFAFPLHVVSERWERRREDRSRIYDFTAVYTLADVGGAWRIAANAHDMRAPDPLGVY